MKQEAERAEKQLEHFRETMDRLTAASHVQTEYFGEHKKIEGYYQSRMQGQMLGCDRLMKQENLFGRLQLGYNPNRERVFLFANLKTSRYDTVASRYQKELKEYQQKTLLKGNNENRAYVSRYWEGASVLNREAGEQALDEALRRLLPGTGELWKAVQKTLPFFRREEGAQQALEELPRPGKKSWKRRLRRSAAGDPGVRRQRKTGTELRAQRSQEAGELRTGSGGRGMQRGGAVWRLMLIRKDAACPDRSCGG